MLSPRAVAIARFCTRHFPGRASWRWMISASVANELKSIEAGAGVPFSATNNSCSPARELWREARDQAAE